MATSQMSLAWHSIAFLWCVIIIPPALGQQTPPATVEGMSNRNTAQDATAAQQDSDEGHIPPSELRGALLQALEQMIEISRQMGDSEDAATIQAYRDQIPLDDPREYSVVAAKNAYELASYLRKG